MLPKGGARPRCGHLMPAGSQSPGNSQEEQSWVLLPCCTVQGGEAGVKGLGWLFLREQFKKKRLIWQRERENGEEVPDCTCFSSHEKVAVWQRITY